MGGLGNHSAAEDADSNRVRGLFHELPIMAKNVEAKQAIGLASCDLIEEGEAIFLDCGTTTHHVAQHLATRGLHLTVLTNSPSISECLADSGGITHILLGGKLRRKSGGGR
jgi:DeoR/GlpR family transcriptional regulator of sugar metabolism